MADAAMPMGHLLHSALGVVMKAPQGKGTLVLHCGCIDAENFDRIVSLSTYKLTVSTSNILAASSD